MKVNGSLAYQFKGKRTYVHGTDIFNKSIELLNEKEIDFDELSMSINQVIVSNLDYVITDENISGNEYPVRFELDKDDKTYYCLLKENGSKVVGRYEYPEEKIIEKSQFDEQEKSLTLDEDSGYSTIENAVALNKGLMERLFPEAGGKWYFVKLEVNKSFFQKADSICIELNKNMNLRLVKSVIKLNGVIVGHIYFSLKK